MPESHDTSKTALVAIDFHGDQIVTFHANGEPHVAMRRIVENLGMSWPRQMRKLEGDARFSCCHMATTGADGKTYEMLAMPVSKLPLWLASVSPAKVALEVRPKLEMYQAESAIALHDYWTKGVAVRGDMDGIVTSIDPAAMRSMGGMFKGILQKALSELVPALVKAEVGSQQYGVVHGLTAGRVLDMAGITNRKGLRGLARFVSDRLRRFHAERGVPVKLAELGQSTAYVFDPLVSREWLDIEGKQCIDRRIAERRGQGKLQLIAG